MQRFLTVEVTDSEIFIGEENSSGAHYLIADKTCPLDSIVQSFSDYVYTYLSGPDDNV